MTIFYVCTYYMHTESIEFQTVVRNVFHDVHHILYYAKSKMITFLTYTPSV